MEPQRILMTGSSGFLGSAVRGRLQTASDAPKSELIAWTHERDGSLLSRDSQLRALDAHCPKILMHFAWHPTKHPRYELDLEHFAWGSSTLTLAKECLTRGIWFICAGSAADSDGGSHLGGSAYATSKKYLRLQLSEYLMSQPRMSWLQIQYVFSIRSRRPRLLDTFLSVPDKQGFTPASPDHRHDFIAVADVVEGVSTVLRHDLKGIVVIGSGRMFTTHDFINALRFRLGLIQMRPVCNATKSDHLPNALLQNGWLPTNTNEFFGITESNNQI